jgi:CDP-glucose 4,6-dehydratase
MGTVNVLQAIRATPSVTTALVVTTDKVYENREWTWGYRECDMLGGHEPYGVSKACAELAVDVFRQSYFSGARTVGIATIRAGNIIGGGDWAANRLIPDAVRAFSAGRPLAPRNPAATRPWQHVLDPLRGYLMLGQRLAADAGGWSGPWNFGPAEDDAVPVATVADELARLWGNGARWQGQPVESPADAAIDTFRESHFLALSSSQAQARLGWRPVWRLQRALAETVGWYKAHLAQGDMDAFSLQQIAIAEGAN